jgi:DNA-binding Lrp family transcriptional regulator
MMEMSNIQRLDAVDREILFQLQREGRLTNVELAQRVGLTPPPCLRRVKRLEETGVIAGYRAIVDPAAMDLGFEVLVLVTMRREDHATLVQFEDEIANVPNVLLAQRLFGDPDYLLRVVCADAADYQRLQDTRLSTLPGVGRFNSTLVMKHVVRERPILGP